MITKALVIVSLENKYHIIVTYTYTFTDCAGHTNDWVYTYTIQNTVAPQGKKPSDLTVQCIGDFPAPDTNAVTNIAGNCNDSVTVTITDTNNGGSGCISDPYIAMKKGFLIQSVDQI